MVEGVLDMYFNGGKLFGRVKVKLKGDIEESDMDSLVSCISDGVKKWQDLMIEKYGTDKERPETTGERG